MNVDSKTQTKDFYGLNFYIDKNVLTPRPETEQLIDEVLTLCGQPILPGVKPQKARLNSGNLKILDVGTGSGCIAITLKKHLKNAEVFATDISEKAIKIAQKNAATNGAPITFIISHLLEKVKFTPDLIVANLPYVDPNWDWLEKESLKDDPEIALYAKDGGLALIKELIDTATSKYLILEADPIEHQEIIKYARKKFILINKKGFILSFKYKK